MVRQGMGMRIVAGIIDGILQFVILFVPVMALVLVFGNGYVGRLISTTVAVALVGAYTSLEYFRAQTPGKMMFKMIVTNQDGSVASKDQLLKRWLFKFSPSIVALIAAIAAVQQIGYLGNALSLLILISALMCARASRLALHDEWFGTAVYGPGTEPVGFPVGPTTPPTPTA